MKITLVFATTNMKLLIGIAFSILFCSCSEKRSDDPKDVYRLWSNQDPSKDVQVIHGKYWQSGHFTKEYIMYLELKASDKWRKEFFKQNQLIPDTSKLVIPSDAPEWFIPKKNSKIWKPSDLDQGSRYFEDSTQQRLFIYEIQL